MNDHRTLCGLYFLREEIRNDHKAMIKDAMFGLMKAMVPRA